LSDEPEDESDLEELDELEVFESEDPESGLFDSLESDDFDESEPFVALAPPLRA